MTITHHQLEAVAICLKWISETGRIGSWEAHICVVHCRFFHQSKKSGLPGNTICPHTYLYICIINNIYIYIEIYIYICIYWLISVWTNIHIYTEYVDKYFIWRSLDMDLKEYYHFNTKTMGSKIQRSLGALSQALPPQSCMAPLCRKLGYGNCSKEALYRQIGGFQELVSCRSGTMCKYT